jgi:protein-L-isoaspartate(D-aspartate) O-methyltransferase
MDKYWAMREDMVNSQIIMRGITDRLVINAMKKVPRHVFVPVNLRPRAYEDCALPIGNKQTISQPYMVAIMTQLLGLKGGETVMEVGTGSGYQAAILAEIAGQVYTIEINEYLAETAKKTLEHLGYKNLTSLRGDGSFGLPDKAPFDAIIVTAGGSNIPKTLTNQLKDGGILIMPVGDPAVQTLTIAKKEGNQIKTEGSIDCVFVPLIGKYA